MKKRYENEKLQEVYEEWVRAVINTYSEYDGMSEESAEELIYASRQFLKR